MTKLTSEAIKLLIVSHAKENQDLIIFQFCEGNSVEIIDSATKAKNWKRIIKRVTESGNIQRVFDCLPLDDQLRAYVTSNSTDTEILKIEIIGE